MTATRYSIWFGGFGTSDDMSSPTSFGRREVDEPRDSNTLPEPDAALVAQIRAGDVRAFESLFSELHPPLVRFAHSCGVMDDEADDVVVDVFAAVWDSRETWAPARSVAAYFFRAIRNRALNVARNARVAAHYVSAAARDQATPLMSEPPEAADLMIEAAERTAGLWEAIATLPERQRVLLTLRWRDGLSIDEIAAVLGIASGATKTALTRAAQALRSVLPDDFL